MANSVLGMNEGTQKYINFDLVGTVNTQVVALGYGTISTVTPGTTATSLGKAEDSAHTTGDVGVMSLGVRNDLGAVLAGTDGDYVPFTTDATGALRTDLNGQVSTNNSTSAVLAGGAVFTGTGEDVLNYNEIRITVIASHASASDGLSIQQSSDNTNWDVTDVYSIPATTGKTYSVPRQARYFRIVYTNGATLQTSFRLQTILNRLGARVSSQRASDGYTNETDLEQQQSFLMNWNGATWDRLKGNTGGIFAQGTMTTNQTTGTVTTGSIVVTAGTIAAHAVTAATITAGTINVGTVNAGTINTGTINVGTFRLNPIPTQVSNSYGTTTTGTIGTLVAAPSAGSGIFITSLDVNAQSGTAEALVSFGLVTGGNGVVTRGNYVAGGGVAKSFVIPNSANITGSALTFNILSGSGTISYNVAYFIAIP